MTTVLKITSYAIEQTNVTAQPLLRGKLLAVAMTFSDKELTIKGFARLFVLLVCTGERGMG